MLQKPILKTILNSVHWGAQWRTPNYINGLTSEPSSLISSGADDRRIPYAPVAFVRESAGRCAGGEITVAVQCHSTDGSTFFIDVWQRCAGISVVVTQNAFSSDGFLQLIPAVLRVFV